MASTLLPQHSFPDQVHHLHSGFSRFLICSFAAVFGGLLIIILLWNPNPGIIITNLILLVCMCYFVWLTAGSRFELTSAGLRYTTFNPFSTCLIPWKSVIRISPTPTLGQYKIVTSNPDLNLTFFTTSVEKYEQLLNGFRAHRVFVERKQQSFPKAKHIKSKEDASSLLNSPKPSKLIAIKNPNLFLFIGILISLVFVVYLLISISLFAPSNVEEGLLNIWISFIFGIVGFWMLEHSLNGYVKIHPDGVNFSHGIAKRHFVLWNDVLFVRILDVQLKYGTTQYLQVMSKCREEPVGTVIADTEAFEELLKQITLRKIPMLGETDDWQYYLTWKQQSQPVVAETSPANSIPMVELTAVA